jgi:hypothetical protein
MRSSPYFACVRVRVCVCVCGGEVRGLGVCICVLLYESWFVYMSCRIICTAHSLSLLRQ